MLSDPTDTSSHSLGYRHRAVLQGLNWNPWERLEQLINLNLNNKVHRPRNTGKPALLHGVPKTGFQTTYGSRLVFIGADLQINYRRLHNQLSRPQGINHCKREREREKSSTVEHWMHQQKWQKMLWLNCQARSDCKGSFQSAEWPHWHVFPRPRVQASSSTSGSKLKSMGENGTINQLTSKQQST